MIKAYSSKEEAKEQNKLYRENNKEHIAEHKKEYYENNKERIAEYKKEYRIKNYKMLQIKEKESILCSCGMHYTIKHFKRHERTKKHLNYLEQLNKKEISTECINVKQL
jgi:hypothetical protein